MIPSALLARLKRATLPIIQQPRGMGEPLDGRRISMKRLYSAFACFALAAFTLFSATTAAAQSKLRINIPFAFTANHQQLPAGSYYVTWLGSGVIQVLNRETGDAQFLMVRPHQGRVIETRSRFVFQQEGRRYYLANVWVAGSSMHSEMLVQHRPERGTDLAKAPSTKTVEIEAN
jgi:hypothetical protein